MRYGDHSEASQTDGSHFRAADLLTFVGFATLSVLEGIIFVIVILSVYHRFG
jgi:uncharacterized membrane protein